MSYNIRYKNVGNELLGTMYRVEVYGFGDTDNAFKEIDDWINGNLESNECLIYGKLYLFENESDVLAFKLMWEE